jgi:hypothetical protein
MIRTEHLSSQSELDKLFLTLQKPATPVVPQIDNRPLFQWQRRVVEEEVFCLNTPSMRAIRGNDHMRARQGALDLNAYLLTQISNKQIPANGEDMDLIYLNLVRLS